MADSDNMRNLNQRQFGGGVDPLQVSRSIDKIAEQVTINQAANFAEPPWHLLRHFIPEKEMDGWMYMGEDKNPHPHDTWFKEYHPTLHRFKHGISRYGIGISPHGINPRIKSGDLEIHYARMAEQNESPETPYNEEYIAKRNKRLADAGWNVVSGELG